MSESGKTIRSKTLELDLFQSCHITKKNAEASYFTQPCVPVQHSKKYNVFCYAKMTFSNRYIKNRELLPVNAENFPFW